MNSYEKLINILEREAHAEQAHRIALDVIRSSSYRMQNYEHVVSLFNMLLKGIKERDICAKNLKVQGRFARAKVDP